MPKKSTTHKDWFKVYYSQNMEDLIIKSFFPDKRNGFYIDIGAHDPDHFSVTKLFYEEGWSGINVEPQPGLFKLLSKKRPKDINLEAAVSNKRGTLTLRQYPQGSGLSTLSDRMKKSYSSTSRLRAVTSKYKDIKVNVLTLQDIFKEHVKGREVDFLKIDVEGHEMSVIEGNNWGKNRPKVICVESNHIEEDWPKLLIDNDYEEALFDGLNKYYIDKRLSKKLWSSFDYVKVALDQMSVQAIPFKTLDDQIQKQDSEIHKLYNLIKKQDEHIKYLERLNEELAEKARNPIKKVASKIKNKVKK